MTAARALVRQSGWISRSADVLVDALPTLRSGARRDAFVELSLRRGVQILVVLLLLSGCRSFDDPPQGIEIGRTPSPDGYLDAVLTEGGGDATTGVMHDVYIVPHGSPLPPRHSDVIAILEWAIRNESNTGLTLRWRGNDTLALEYLRARHTRLWRPSVTGRNGPVTVVLVNGVADTSYVARRAEPPRK